MARHHFSFLFTFCLMATHLAACTATVREKHYFASVAPATATSPERLVNIFRVEIGAEGGFANVRYLSGNYDERAVDFFLNESGSTTQSQEKQGFPRIWNINCPDASGTDACKTAYDQQLSVIPLTAGGANANDTFVIIMSTNATAIADTIGSIAENAETIKSLTYLLNKDTFEAEAALTATSPKKDEHRKALVAALTQMLTGYESNAAVDDSIELAILKALAAELQPDAAIPFQTLEQAKAWFATVK